MRKYLMLIVTLACIVCLLGVGAYELTQPGGEYAEYENRLLAAKPVFGLTAYFDGTYEDQLESFLLEHFPLREVGITASQTLRKSVSLASWEDYARVDSAVSDDPLTAAVEDTGLTEDVLSDVLPTARPVAASTPAPTAPAAPSATQNEPTPLPIVTPRPVKPEPDIPSFPYTLGVYSQADDQVSRIHAYSRAAVLQRSALFDTYAALLPEDGTLTLTFVPYSRSVSRMMASANPQGMFSDVESFVQAVTADNVMAVSATDILSPYVLNGDYVYFRTDMHWTPLGAYYVYCEMVRLSGKMPTPYEAFSVTQESPFLGTLYRENPTKQMEQNPDTLDIMVPPGAVTVLRAESRSSFVEIPLIDQNADARDRYTVYLGGSAGPWTILKSDADTEDRCLVLTDSYGLCIVPMFTGQYSEVHYCDARYYSKGEMGCGIADMIREYGIKDIYIVLGTLHSFDNDYLARCSTQF